MALRSVVRSGPPQCEGCPYRRARTCGPRGDIEAPLAIVGEAPGAQEIKAGDPFIGPSGELLRRTLDRFGVDLHEAYITNAMYCRPKDSPPSKQAIDACSSRLHEELDAAPRKVILALGNSALRSITRDHKLKITAERGKAIELDDGTLVVPTFHPAAILRNGGDFPRFAADLDYAAKLLNGAKQKSAGECKVTLIDSRSKLRKLLELRGRLLACDIETSGLSPRLDRVLSFGLAYAKNRVAVVPERYIESREVRKLLADRSTTFIWHNGKYDTAFFHHLGMPARVDEDTMLIHYSLDETKATHDLGQLATELLGAPDYKQAFRKQLGAKGWAGMADKMAEDPDFEATVHRYNALDCDSTWQLFQKLHADLSKPKNEPSWRLYYSHLLPASDFLQTVEDRGIWIDQEHLASLRVLFEARLEDAKQRLDEAVKPIWDPELYFAESRKAQLGKLKKVPTRFVPGNADHVLWIANKILPLHVPDAKELTLRNAAQGIADTAAAAGSVGASRMKKEDLAATWTGKSQEQLKSERQKRLAGKDVTVPAAAGAWVSRAEGQAEGANVGRAFLGAAQAGRPDIGPQILQALFDYREAKKALSTWINGIDNRIEPDGRVHSTFKLIGTETGRLSSSDPNFQNIPVKKKDDKPEEIVRNVFHAMPGCTLIELDYSQAELRLLAHLADDDWLIGIYQTDRDLHTEVAIALYGPSYSYQQRMRAKAVNFGIAYGRSAYSLMGEFGITVREAQRMVDEWFGRAPNVKRFLDYCRTWVRKGQSDPTPFGRRRRFPMITADTLKDLGNEAANFPMQSTASDLTLTAALEIDQWLEESGLAEKAAQRGLMCGVVNLVHDSILIECPADWRESVALKASEIMSAVPKRVLKSRVPFTVDWHSADAWADCK